MVSRPGRCESLLKRRMKRGNLYKIYPAATTVPIMGTFRDVGGHISREHVKRRSQQIEGTELPGLASGEEKHEMMRDRQTVLAY